jgi:hypothetical protein
MNLVFGATAPQLWQQVKCDRPTMALSQKCADAITLLSIHSVLSDAEVHRARQRLVKRIRETVNEHRK